jgi:hypothetical protein
MANDNNRVDGKSVVTGSPIVLPKNSPDRVFLRKTVGIDIEEGTKTEGVTPFLMGSSGSGSPGSSSVSEANKKLPPDPNPPAEIIDIPQLTDIENITYQQYFDTFNSVRIKAIIKIRNSSLKKKDVIGVDARSQQSNQAPALALATPTPVAFIAPSPSVPSVKFDRTGTAIAWGWNNVSGLGSYSNVYYDWQIRSNSGTTGSVLSSGRKNYVSNASNLQVGDSGVFKDYRVSSAQGDTPATASSRWLRVVAVIIGTDGKTYTSSYSTPI